MLIIDDANLAQKENLQEFLSLLEGIRDPNCLVIATMMIPSAEASKPQERSSVYLPGMRPGRIDEIITLPSPDEEDREMVLALYCEREGLSIEPACLRAIAKASEGLTGAYLGHLIERIGARGQDHWEQELQKVMCSAPP